MTWALDVVVGTAADGRLTMPPWVATGDFSISLRFNYAYQFTNQTLLSQSDNNFMYLGTKSSNNTIYISIANVILESTYALSVDEWVDVNISRVGNLTTLDVNGTEDSSTLLTDTLSFDTWAILNAGGNKSQALFAGTWSFEADGTTSRIYDFEVSAHEVGQPIVVETVSGQDAVGSNFPALESAWVSLTEDDTPEEILPLSFIDLGAQFDEWPSDVAAGGVGLTVYVVDYSSLSLYKSVDGGLSFVNLGQQFSTSPRRVACSADGDIVYVTDFGNNSLYKSVDGGSNFSLVFTFSGDPESVACSADGSIVYVARGGRAYKSVDGGQTFPTYTTVDPGYAFSLACDESGVIVYAGLLFGNGVSKSTDGGASFSNMGVTLGGSPQGIACDSSGNFVFVTCTGDDSLYMSIDEGASFSNQGAQFGSNPFGVDCSQDGSVVYVVDSASDSLYRSGVVTPPPTNDKIQYNGQTVTDVKYSDANGILRSVQMQINGVSVWE